MFSATDPGPVLFLELDAHAQHWIATNSDRRWALLLEYWNRLAQRLGHVPGRADIDPLDLPVDLLPNVFLVDVVRGPGAPAPRFRFRLLGTAITVRETLRPGQFLDDSLKGRMPDDITPQYLACLERRVRLARLRWRPEPQRAQK